MADNKNKLYVKRYKTLKEHRAAVAARKALQGGKNKGPVANSDAYGETLKKKEKKKPTPKPTASKPSVKPTPKPSAPKPRQGTRQDAASRFYSSSSPESKKKNKLYVKRYKTLKEHRAAVAARKALKGGKNKGPVANADAYGETLTKKKKKPATPKPTASKPSPKPTPKPTAPKPRQGTRQDAASRFYSSSSPESKKKNNEKAKANFFAGGKGGKYDTETKPVFNRRGRKVGTKEVQKKQETKKKRVYNRRGRRVG